MRGRLFEQPVTPVAVALSPSQERAITVPSKRSMTHLGAILGGGAVETKEGTRIVEHGTVAYYEEVYRSEYIVSGMFSFDIAPLPFVSVELLVGFTTHKDIPVIVPALVKVGPRTKNLEITFDYGPVEPLEARAIGLTLGYNFGTAYFFTKCMFIKDAKYKVNGQYGIPQDMTSNLNMMFNGFRVGF
jgi:hypothetical protein